MPKKVLITGSAGLIGSEAVKFFCSLGREVVGIDNNMREYFFGSDASTDWNRELLQRDFVNYTHYKADIRNAQSIEEIFSQNDFDLIIHTAAQPSHDWAAKEPLTDFSVNATGTLILLEAYKKHCPEAVFIFTSTNKVYGDTPNRLPLIELETRWEIAPEHLYKNGIDESMSVDDSKHSIFGASKVAADIMVQEYGRYFNLQTAGFRGGCLTGPAHSGTKLHGFLAYLVKCIAEGIPYTIFGYKGKQVRDNIHSYDLVSAFYEFYKSPRIGEVYNIGGSRYANVSMMEAIEKIETFLGRKGNITYIDENRIGDHIWYVSDVSKFQNHYPNWKYKYDIDATIQEMCEVGHFSKPTVVGGSVISGINYGSDKKIFVASHVTEMSGHVQALKSYLIRRFPRFTFIEHPFSYTDHQFSSKYGEFRASLPSDEKIQKRIKYAPINYLSNLILTLYWFIKKSRDSKLFIGIDNLNTFAGVILKKLGFNFTLVYYSVDFVPRRFKNFLINYIYHKIDSICVQNADYVWNSHERLYSVRRAQIGNGSGTMLVESGVFSDKVKVYGNDNKEKYTLVIIDHFTETKNIQLVISCLKDLIEINPKVRLLVFGTGPFKPELEKLANKLGVSEYVEFRGPVEPDVYLKEIGRYGIGLSLQKNTDSSTYFADSITVKEMLAAGIPVIVSNELWISSVVREKKLGKAIYPTKKELIQSVRELWTEDTLYDLSVKNAIEYTKDLSWSNIFDVAFKQIKFFPDSEDIKHLDIAIVTHEYFKGSGQELKEFLIENSIHRVFYVAHMFNYAKDSVSYMEDYISGELVNKRESLKYPNDEFLYYLRDIFHSIYFFLFSKGKFDIYVGVNSFNALFGIFLKKIGKVDKVVFFTIDYIMEKRFKNPFLNKLYVSMDRLAFFGSDYTWNVSDRMAKRRIIELGDQANKKPQLVVPIGVPIDEAQKVQVKREENVLVYSGSLNEGFGLELLVESIPELVKKIPNVEIRIIGAGPLEEKLKSRIKELNVEKSVNFIGFINTTSDRQRWLKLLKESTVGIAVYQDTKDSYKRYSDVTKPKDYMACGLPVVTTSVVPISDDIRDYNLGRVVEDSVDSFVKGIVEIVKNEKERTIIEKNVEEYSKNITWDSIFKKVLHEMHISSE